MHQIKLEMGQKMQEIKEKFKEAKRALFERASEKYAFPYLIM